MKKKTTLWVGYLDAGKSSSPVLRDSSLDTGNPATIYLFNLMRGRILEYRRDIVELKLREFTPEEVSLAAALKDAFQGARAGFKPRGELRASAFPPHRRSQPKPLELPDVDIEDAWPPFEDDSASQFAAEDLD